MPSVRSFLKSRNKDIYKLSQVFSSKPLFTFQTQAILLLKWLLRFEKLWGWMTVFSFILILAPMIRSLCLTLFGFWSPRVAVVGFCLTTLLWWSAAYRAKTSDEP